MRDFVYISDRAYTKDQVLGMEKIMLNTLKFNLTVPTPHNFLTRFLKVSPVSEHHPGPAQYLFGRNIILSLGVM